MKEKEKYTKRKTQKHTWEKIRQTHKGEEGHEREREREREREGERERLANRERDRNKDGVIKLKWKI